MKQPKVLYLREWVEAKLLFEYRLIPPNDRRDLASLTRYYREAKREATINRREAQCKH